jgi:iron complex outermembrane recepter protein
MLRSLALLPLLALGQPALAAEAAADTAPETTAPADETVGALPGEILVVGSRLVDSVIAAQPPLVTLDEEDIASYGAANLTDLIAALGPQTGTGRGRGGGFPVVLLNGQRVGSFREMREFPPEAIRRVEVLPEEVALRYGYSANQRVINFILKDNFLSKTIDGEINWATRGGFATSEGKVSLLRIAGPSRFNANVYVENNTLLSEAERGLVQPAPGREP